MHNLSDINQIKALLSRHGFSFSKALGQNFIIDPTVCPDMADAAVFDSSYGVIEIGPGIGVLTVELAKRAKKVVTVELDTRLLPILDETLSEYDNVKVINSDIMKLDLHKVIEEEFPDMPVVVCANLPYYITSPIIMMLLESKLSIESITVMVQAEAADRLCAPVGTRDAGAVTVAVNFYAEANELFFVPREAFMPSPKVDSKVIQLKVHQASAFDIHNEKAFFSMVKGAFSMRRKTIMNSIPAGINTGKDKLEAVLNELGISKTARIEQLTMDELIEIYTRLT